MNVSILHYSSAPVVGGVEAVISEHARLIADAGINCSVISGRGKASALPEGVAYVQIAEIDSLNADISIATEKLNKGIVPDNFEILTGKLHKKLRMALKDCDVLIVHNVLTKHFNLPLTAAVLKIHEEQKFTRLIAWCHDLSWTSLSSKKNVYPDYPWNLLKDYRPDIKYVAISEQRKKEICESFGCEAEVVNVIPNGVDPKTLLGLSDEGMALSNRMSLWQADLILLMPVRITQAKNIELGLLVVRALVEKGLFPRLVVSGPPDPHNEESMKYFQGLLIQKHDLALDDFVYFVYDSGPIEGKEYIIDSRLVGEIYRLADALFMPSHREGFGMPVLEAGMIGLPVISTKIPVVEDLGLKDVLLLKSSDDAEKLSEEIIDWIGGKAEYKMKKMVRQNFTWEAIFQKMIKPLLEGEKF